MIKKMNKKSKSIFAGLIIIPLFIILILFIVRSCSKTTTSYSKYENEMKKAAEKYFNNKNLLPKTEGGKVSVSLDELVSEEYIKSSDVRLKDDGCTGSVNVQNNGGYYLYIPDLECDNYKTVHLIDMLLKDVVTEKSGLYATADGYVYKGAKVNNYLKFFDKLYLIISIDNDGILKLVKVESEKDKSIWDRKFNTKKINRLAKMIILIVL